MQPCWSRTPKARPRSKVKKDIGPKRGVLFGAITGGLVGLLGGPAGVILGAAAGVTAGGAAAKGIDMGFSDEKLALLQKRLQPDNPALVVLIEHRWVEEVLAAQAGWQGKLVRQRLTDETVTQILE